MALEQKYASKDLIPASPAELYVERDGAFVYRENLALGALTDAEVLVAGVPRL